jgi:hypothetical protein
MENLTHWKQEFNYDYLGSYSLLPNEEKTLTIKETKKVKVKGPDGKEQECFVAYFSENEKPMILNKTNCKTISKVYNSPYIEQWKGIRIVVFAQSVKAFGDVVDALRVKNINPDSNLLGEIEELFKLKKDALKPEQVTAILRVTSQKEIRSYNKTLNFLKSL